MSTQLTLFQAAFHASHFQSPDNEKELRMTATSGRKCLELFTRFHPDGSWQKTFMAYLVLTGEWSSNRCSLTWKLKGTKYNRLYFQLRVSVRPTSVTGSSLLPTPQPLDRGAVLLRRRRAGGRASKNVKAFSGPLSKMAMRGMLPTPTATDYKGSVSQQALIRKDGKSRADTLRNLPVLIGASGQLNPLFVAEMMGFPFNWTVSPFHPGGKKASRH